MPARRTLVFEARADNVSVVRVQVGNLGVNVATCQISLLFPC